MARGVYQKIPGRHSAWWILYYDAEGKRHREKLGNKQDAIDAYRKRKADAAAGKKLDRPLRQREKTFKEFAALALTFSREHKANPRDDEYKIATLAAEFGDRPADSLTQQELTAFLDNRKFSPASFNRYRACLSMIYREAMRAGWTEKNPARLMKAKKEPNGRIRYLTSDEDKRLRKVIAKSYPDFLIEFEFSIRTGARLSEQFALKWSEVDLEQKRITFLKSKHGGDRHVSLSPTIRAALKAHHKVTGKRVYVFVSQAGKPFKRSPIRHWFDEALEAAKIPDYTWHCNRHTFCSRLIMAGVGLKTAQELMGHKTIQMTARYAHLAPEHLQDAVDSIDG
jgi:site-specific recombinase XerD